MKLKLPHWAVKLALSMVDVEAFSDTAKPDMRIYEYSWTLSRLVNREPGTLLDIGCTASLNIIPATLCNLGWKVYGLDIREFQFSHENFTFVREIPKIKFDAITAISSLEHFGISGRYGIQKNDLTVAKNTVDNAAKRLVEDGTIIITVPFTNGTSKISKSMMIYNEKTLLNLVKPLDIVAWSFKTIGKETTAMIEALW